MSTIKKCDVCKSTATTSNPTRKMTIFYGKDVINGNDKFYQQEIDMCLNCRNSLRTLTARMEYEFVQDALYKEVESPTGSPVENGYYEKEDIDYVLSEDTEVDESKTYYEKIE